MDLTAVEAITLWVFCRATFIHDVEQNTYSLKVLTITRPSVKIQHQLPDACVFRIDGEELHRTFCFAGIEVVENQLANLSYFALDVRYLSYCRKSVVELPHVSIFAVYYHLAVLRYLTRADWLLERKVYNRL